MGTIVPGSTFIGYTGQVVTYTVSTTGLYDIVTYGASGGDNGGLGAEIGGDVALTAGTTLDIVVGGQGTTESGTSNQLGEGSTDYYQGGGGGGASFVYTPGATTPLMEAGGGGGGFYMSVLNSQPLANGQTGTAGVNIGSHSYGAGQNGAGGSGGTDTGDGSEQNGIDYASGGGGGFDSAGGKGTASAQTQYLGLGGGAGDSGNPSGGAIYGGFGGGGGAILDAGGGGGGYSGGGGSGPQGEDGGGGGSYDSGTNQVLVSGENSGNGKVSFTLLDTPPTFSGVMSTETITSGRAASFLFSTVSVGGFAASEPITVTVSLPPIDPLNPNTADPLALLDPNAAADGSTFSNGTYTVTGTAAADTTALQGLLLLSGYADPPPGDTITTIKLAATDPYGLSTSAVTTVTQTGTGRIIVGDPEPSSPITASQSATSVSTTDEASVSPFAGVSITDSNFDQTETAIVSVGTAANGTLADPNAATDLSTTSNGTITITGSASAVATALDGLTLTPTPHQATPGTVVATTVTAAISDTRGQQTSLASTINATAANDAPVITVGSTATGQATQDTASIQPFTTASVSDVDTGVQDSLTIVLSSAANGTLTGTGLTASSTPGTYTLAAAVPAMLTSELQALTFTPTAHEAAAGTTVTTTFALTASQTAGGSTVTSATNSATSVVATETSAYNVVNGRQGGFATIQGTTGNDQITASGSFNAIFADGGNDLINAGSGEAAVTLGNGNSSVTLGGGFNAVLGGSGNTSVTGGSNGYNLVTLGNGNDTASVGGSHDVIVLGTGTDMVSGTQGMSFITTGGGNDTITIGGAGNTVSAGGGMNTISGGTSSNTFVLAAAGQGFDSISGFTETNGDVLNLHAALAATKWNGQASTLANYLKVTDSGGSATLSIAPTGSGSGTAVATLVGSGNLGLSDLVSHHSIST